MDILDDMGVSKLSAKKVLSKKQKKTTTLNGFNVKKKGNVRNTK